MLGQTLAPQRLKPVLRKYFGREPVPSWMEPAWVARHQVTAGYQEPVLPRRDRMRHTLRDSLLESSIPSLLRYEDLQLHALQLVESRVRF